MYYFNYTLFKNLSSIFKMTQVELSNKVFGNDHRYMNRVHDESIILVSDMINICNALHMSMSHFISLKPDFYYRDKSIEYIINESLFIPLSFSGESLKQMYGKDGLAGSITKEELAKGIGVSTPVIYLWISKPQCSMKISQLIEMCNVFGVNIGSFIKDENIPLPMNDVIIGKSIKSSTKYYEELLDLREVVSHNNQEIAKLQLENKSLKLSLKSNYVAEEQKTYASSTTSIRKFVFNKELLDNLPNLLNTSKRDFFLNIGMSNPALSYYDGNITVQLLIDICNKYQLSTKHFFIREQEDIIIKDISFYRCDKFKYILFHPEYINDLFGKNSLTDLSLPEVLERLGCSEMKIRNWRKTEKSTLRVEELVEICNALNVTPSCFIIDQNRTFAAYSTTQAEFFLEENRMLRQEIIRLKETVKRLKSKKQTIK